MALQIAKSTNFGTDALYWRIGAVNLFIRGRQARVIVEGFSSLEAARSGSLPMTKREIAVPYDEVELLPEYDSLRRHIYLSMKNDAEWDKAEDV